MHALDRRLLGLEAAIDALPRRHAAVLFAAASDALRPDLVAWCERRGTDRLAVRDGAVARGLRWALTGEVPAGTDALLDEVERLTPEGASPDALSSTAAQDCWICADVVVRLIVEPQFSAGGSIGYALEPTVQAASERRHGVTEVGDGPDEAAMIAQVVAEPDVARALAFVDWAIDALGAPGPLTEATVARVRQRGRDLR